MSNKTRRDILKTAAITTATTLVAPAFVRGQNLNSKIRVAVVGMGGRSNAHGASLVELEKESTAGVEFAGVCDCDEAKRKAAEKFWGDRSGHAIKTYDDMRRVLDDTSIDAVTFATPNHWHSLNVIWGCQAG
ncbi:MAG: Gfo/Idh/MocA family oxidoreductase [Pirellulaceae bacterium]